MRRDPRLWTPPEDALPVFFDVLHATEPRTHDDPTTMRLLLRRSLPTWCWRRGEPCPVQGMVPNTTCSVCIETYSDGQRLLGLVCGHTYHYRCVLDWFQSVALEGTPPACPQCRQYIFGKPNRTFYGRMHI